MFSIWLHIKTLSIFREVKGSQHTQRQFLCPWPVILIHFCFVSASIRFKLQANHLSNWSHYYHSSLVEDRSRCHLWDVPTPGKAGLRERLSFTTKPVNFSCGFLGMLATLQRNKRSKEQKTTGHLFCGLEIAHSLHTDHMWLWPTGGICLT